MGSVEEAGLEEQDEGDPLIVGLVLDLQQGLIKTVPSLVLACSVHNLLVSCIVLSHPWVN